jgi:hypothetical protein
MRFYAYFERNSINIYQNEKNKFRIKQQRNMHRIFHAEYVYFRKTCGFRDNETEEIIPLTTCENIDKYNAF